MERMICLWSVNDQKTNVSNVHEVAQRLDRDEDKSAARQQSVTRDDVRHASLHKSAVIRHFAAVIVLMIETEPRRIRWTTDTLMHCCQTTRRIKMLLDLGIAPGQRYIVLDGGRVSKNCAFSVHCLPFIVATTTSRSYTEDTQTTVMPFTELVKLCRNIKTM